jgi:hypothetical protein
MSRSQAAVRVSHHSQNADNWLRTLVLCYCEQPATFCAYERWTLKTAAQNICCRVIHMQSRTELLKACGGGETVTVRSIMSSWRIWSRRLTLLYHVVYVRFVVLGMLRTGTRESSPIDQNVLQLQNVKLCIVYISTYVLQTVSILTFLHAYIHTYMHTHTHTHIRTYICTSK